VARQIRLCKNPDWYIEWTVILAIEYIYRVNIYNYIHTNTLMYVKGFINQSAPVQYVQYRDIVMMAFVLFHAMVN